MGPGYFVDKPSQGGVKTTPYLSRKRLKLHTWNFTCSYISQILGQMQNFRPFGPLVRPGPDHWSANLPISTFFTETAAISSFLGILIQTQRHSTDNIQGNKKRWYQNLSMTSLRGSKSRSKLKKNIENFSKSFFSSKSVIFAPNSPKLIFYVFSPSFMSK